MCVLIQNLAAPGRDPARSPAARLSQKQKYPRKTSKDDGSSVRRQRRREWCFPLAQNSGYQLLQEASSSTKFERKRADKERWTPSMTDEHNEKKQKKGALLVIRT